MNQSDQITQKRSVLLKWTLIALVAAVLSPCGISQIKKEAEFSLTPLNSPSIAADSSKLFDVVPPSVSGLDFIIPIDNTHPDRRLYYSAFACGGVSAGDFDLDGKPDLFFSNGPIPNRLFRQNGDLQFEDITQSAGLHFDGIWSAGTAVVDIDGDGDLDIYVCNYDAPNQLFINESTTEKIHFSEQASAWGIDVIDACLTPSFQDYDRDGDLDLFIGINGYFRKGGYPDFEIPVRTTDKGAEPLPPWDRFFKISGITDGKLELAQTGRPNLFFKNEGNKKFSNVTKEVGIVSTPSHTNAVTWWDFDNDGLLDLYVGNDFYDPDELYHNNGNGTFTEISTQVLQHTTWFSMGSSSDDINNDGRFDFISVDMMPTTHYRQKVTMGHMDGNFEKMEERGKSPQKMVNTVYLNTGTGLSFEAASLLGLAQTNWTWTAKSGDYDNDGHIDYFFPNGHTRDFNNSDNLRVPKHMLVGKNYWDYYETEPEFREGNLFFRNEGALQFSDVSSEWGVQGLTMSYDSAVADFDRDGDLDFVVTNLEDPPTVYRNNSQDHQRVLLSLKGKAMNPMGMGATVTIETDSGIQTRCVSRNGGYVGSDEALLHFGLGEESVINRLTVKWPSGNVQKIDAIPAGNWVTITEEDGIFESDRRAPVPLFAPTDSLVGARSEEIEFNDFYRQPLLPYKHSHQGPGQAWADVNGDGLTDIFIGGPRERSGQLLIHQGVGENGEPVYARHEQSLFVEDSKYEDTGVVFLDVDADGDQDLYVVSGSVEHKPYAKELQDRLYLNDGKGIFSRAAGNAIPENFDSGSCATVADFDKDGDLDIFVGGRIIPGKYPLPANSRLLVNDGKGVFKDKTKEIAAELLQSGLVTGALWSDTDSDGWLDLLVTHEWGPVKLFQNQKGKLVDTTQNANLSSRTGWWNGIAGADFDRDGDIDYVVTNFGLNTKYHPSKDHPEIIYYGDFDGTGLPHLLEAKFVGDVCYPRRGLSCSSKAMPSVLSKMRTFSNFASASLSEIYSPSLLQNAAKFTATTFESGILINNGEGQFDFEELPRLAQIAPAFGIALTDVDADGFIDCYLAQNFFPTQKETGAMDGGLSLLLKGGVDEFGKPSFRALWPDESGLLVPGDGRSLGVGDLNNDNRPDFVMCLNNSEPRLFLNQATSDKNYLNIRLKGNIGNPNAIGARVTLSADKEMLGAFEIHRGNGYLSQSSNSIFFGLKQHLGQSLLIMIRWPNGAVSEHTYYPDDGNSITINQP